MLLPVRGNFDTDTPPHMPPTSNIAPKVPPDGRYPAAQKGSVRAGDLASQQRFQRDPSRGAFDLRGKPHPGAGGTAERGQDAGPCAPSRLPAENPV